VHKAQRLLQVKWRIFREHNNIAIWNYPDDVHYEIEFTDRKEIRITNNVNTDRPVIGGAVVEWHQTTLGHEIIFESNELSAISLLLVSLTNDTLYYTNNNKDDKKHWLSVSFWATRER
jgi:hypothetical protein